MPVRGPSKPTPWPRLCLGLGGLSLCVLLASLVGSCQQVPTSPDEEPLNAPRRWWNYYRRGLDYSLAGDWQRAARDFEIALGRRPGALFGRDREARRAKTYGLHTLDDYFPLRELGICLLHLNQIAAAEGELSLSMARLPSARAAYYLNEVRRERLRQAGPAAPPIIRIDAATEAGMVFTNRLRLDLTGTLSSAAFVARVWLNGQPLLIELAQAEYRLSEAIRLTPGEQELTVEAEDLLGQRTRWSGRVIVDLNGPQIAVTRLSPGPAGTAQILVGDDRGLATVEINGVAVALTPAQRTVTQQIALQGLDLLTVVAVDQAGNRTTLEAAVADLPQARLPRYPRAAQQARLVSPNPKPALQLAQVGGADSPRPDVAPAAPTPPDTLPPVLELLPALPDAISVTDEIYVLDVKASDQGGIVAIRFGVNGQEESADLLAPGAGLQRLTQPVHLRLGANEVTVTVRDRAGNTRTRALSIHLAPDAEWRYDLRSTAQLLPVPAEGINAAPPMDLCTPLLGALVQDSARLCMLERDPAVLHRIFVELALAGSSLADAHAAIASGKLKTADFILVSRVTAWSGKDNYELFLDIVDTATSEVLFGTDVLLTSAERGHIRSQMECLVAKIGQALPRLTARVASCSGGAAVLPVGSSERVLRGMYVLFLPASSDSPDFPSPLEWEGRWVRGRVTAIKPHSCRIEVDPPEGIVRVRPQGLVTFR